MLKFYRVNMTLFLNYVRAFISDSFYHMIIPQNINISWYYENEKKTTEKRYEISKFALRHNVHVYDVTGKREIRENYVM